MYLVADKNSFEFTVCIDLWWLYQVQCFMDHSSMFISKIYVWTQLIGDGNCQNVSESFKLDTYDGNILV